MGQDPRGRRLSKPEKEAILNDIRSRSLSFQSISKKHQVSISTVSRLAAENGLSSPRKRSSAVEKPEHSYDREQRKSVLDRMLHSIDKMVERGGLSSRQLKDLAGAAKEIAASRRSEDTIPDPRELSRGKSFWGSSAGDEPTYESLVTPNDQGIPPSFPAYMATLDLEEASLEAGSLSEPAALDAQEAAKDRIRDACVKAGLSGEDVPFDKMIAATSESGCYA
jgi:transposase-like protein